ncbi:MAG: hypothetical protein D6705_09010 [Deltaproteobacteria bacterium]|nr:MAG: hypothetical protein D6705_09010 [Deltaproteobacteria bacterium]
MLVVPWVLAAAPAEPPRIGIVAVEGRQPSATSQAAGRLAEALRGVGREVIEDAWAVARATAGYVVSPEERAAHARLVEHLARAEDAVRAGRSQEARALLEEVDAFVAAHPETPDASVLRVEGLWLRAWLAASAGADAEAEDLLRRARALAPSTTPSLRRFPPDVVEKVRRIVLEPSRLPSWRIAADAVVEIDGLTGFRAVPPGVHRVVVRWPGRAKFAAWVDRDAPLGPKVPEEIVGPHVVLDAEAFGTVCRLVGLDHVVAVRATEGAAVVQSYDCGASRFRRHWTGATTEIPRAVDALAGPFVTGPAGPLQDGALSGVLRASPLGDQGGGAVRRRDDATYRRRRRIGWAVAGALGAVALIVGLAVGLSARPRDRIGVDPDEFLRPRATVLGRPTGRPLTTLGP